MARLGAAMRRVQTPLLLAVLLVTMVPLVASASQPPPLGNGGGFDECTPYPASPLFTMGTADLHNTAQDPVTVAGVRLPGLHNLAVAGAWVMPIFHDPKNGNWVLVGDGFPYPPTRWPTWPQRRSAIGAVIRPGQDLNLVIGLTRTSARNGRASGPLVDYVSDRQSFTLTYHINLIVSHRC